MYSDQENEKLGNMKAQAGYAADKVKTKGDTEPCRPSLRERVSSQLHRASSEARRMERLHELSYLLDKNPEVARILDLLDEVRG